VHVPPSELDCDYVAIHGFRRMGWLAYCQANDQPFIHFDKGYRRREKDRGSFWRVGVNDTHPTEYVADAKHNSGRLDKVRAAMGLPLKMPSWRESSSDGPVMIASSSEKFHAFHGLPPPRDWVAETIQEVRRHSNRPILYRPKPSHGDPGPIEGAESVVEIKHTRRLFKGCHVMITYGSYICVDAMLEGVPSIVLGNGVLKHISSTDLADVQEPRLASDDERNQILANLVWTQYTVGEWANGVAWKNTKRLFLR
jgi:hypothetical protein